MKSSSKFIHFHSRKCIWKCRLENGCHFVLASMCQETDPCGGMVKLFQQNWSNTMAADTLAPGITRSSTAMVFTIYKDQVLDFHREIFQCGEIMGTVKYIFMFSQNISPHKGLTLFLICYLPFKCLTAPDLTIRHVAVCFPETTVKQWRMTWGFFQRTRYMKEFQMNACIHASLRFT